MRRSDHDAALSATRPIGDAENEGAASSRALINAPPPVIDGRYVVVCALGEGAMGVVYHARERALDRDVAMKMIAPELSRDKSFAASFQREARAMARIRHQNVAHVYTFGQHDDSWYLAMEFVRGASLADLLAEHEERQDTMSTHVAIALLSDVIAGVGAIHGAGLVHCDLKPGNIMVEHGTGRPVIVDFGLATAARGAVIPIAGTPAYMSPEQHDPDAGGPTEESDIYALGCTAFELLTGRVPYRSRTYAEMVDAHRRHAVPRPSAIRDELEPFDELVLRAMAKDRTARFRSCAEMQAALEDARQRWNRHLDPPLEESDPLSATATVLVVDDDPWFRNAVARAAELAFSQQNVRVLRASSGAEALSLAAQRMPDLVVLDFLLPGLDGVGALSAIRALPRGREAQVIVISGLDEAASRFASLDVAAFLDKPVDLDELMEAMSTAFDRAKRPGIPSR